MTTQSKQAAVEYALRALIVDHEKCVEAGNSPYILIGQGHPGMAPMANIPALDIQRTLNKMSRRRSAGIDEVSIKAKWDARRLSRSTPTVAAPTRPVRL